MALYWICGICEKRVALRLNGRLRSHTNGDSRFTYVPFSSHCEGSGKHGPSTWVSGAA